MKRTIAAAAVTALLAVAGCGQDPVPSTPEPAQPAADAAAPAAAVEPSAFPEPPAIPAQPAAVGAPAFAVLYPGGTPTGPATVARGPSGPGGIVSFTTPASPDAVIDWYRRTAEAAGLTSVMAMNQGDARAYGAAAEDGSGKLLRVVATAVEDGGSNVQLDWTAGK